MFSVKGVLKICSKCTGEHPCRSTILIKLLNNFIGITLRHGCSPVNLLQSNLIEMTLQHGCSPVNLLHIFRTLLDGYFWKVPSNLNINFQIDDYGQNFTFIYTCAEGTFLRINELKDKKLTNSSKKEIIFKQNWLCPKAKKKNSLTSEN